MKSNLILGGFFQLLLWAVGMQFAYGQMPQTISYQGVLTDGNGSAVPDGNYQLDFALYEAGQGGTAIWSEHQSVAMVTGIFNVILGSSSPLSLPFDRPYWLGISIGAGQVQELAPRIRLTASAYSLMTRSIVDGAVTTRKIADRAVTLSKIDTAEALVNQVLTFTQAGIRWSNPPTGDSLNLPFFGTAFGDGDAFSIQNEGSAGRAGYFAVTGLNNSAALTAETIGPGAAAVFQIDSEPLKEITGNHSFVESPDMMNIYNGNVMLGANGEAWVDLPAWFEALNRDFRYQLTAMGAPGPNLYIAEEVAGNRFKIAGGLQGMKVSWQVTGIRQDLYANAHRIPVEEEKPIQERGYYLHPDLYGQSEERGIEWARNHDRMRKMKQKRK